MRNGRANRLLRLNRPHFNNRLNPRQLLPLIDVKDLIGFELIKSELRSAGGTQSTNRFVCIIKTPNTNLRYFKVGAQLERGFSVGVFVMQNILHKIIGSRFRILSVCKYWIPNVKSFCVEIIFQHFAWTWRHVIVYGVALVSHKLWTSKTWSGDKVKELVLTLTHYYYTMEVLSCMVTVYSRVHNKFRVKSECWNRSFVKLIFYSITW